MARVQPTFDRLLGHPVVRALARAADATACHLVGGALRDRLTGRDGCDLDAVTGGRGDAIAGRLAADLPARLVRLGGERFAALRLVGRGFTLDLWDRQSSSLADDLLRRDFTVNAIALDVSTGELVDPLGGVADCERRLLRATGPGVLGEDPLRVLRLVRFAATLDGFRPDAATLGLARAAAPRLTAVAAERVREEMDKALAAADFATGFELLEALDLYPGLLLGRPGEPVEEAGASAAVKRLEDLLAAADAVGAPPADRAASRLALLFRSLGEGGEPAARLAAYRRAGYLASVRGNLCARLLRGRRLRLPAGEPAERRFLYRWGKRWTTAIAYLGAAADPPPSTASWRALVEQLVRLAAAEGERLFAPRPLLDGHEIQQLLGIAPGPRVGELSRHLLMAQVEGRINDRRQAEAALKRLSAGAD